MSIRQGGYGLGFLNDQDLYDAVKGLVARVDAAVNEADPHKNVIDPFSALFESGLVVGLNSNEWLGVERSRQVGKSLANAIGDFHQELIGKLPGWKSTGKSGGVVDLVHEAPFGERATPVMAELKNKFNTMNSSSAEALHSRFQDLLKLPLYKGYTAVLIEVIPRKKGGSDTPWAPSGRGVVERIRRVDAATIYKVSSGGQADAFGALFDALPRVLQDVCGASPDLLVLEQDPGFRRLFDKAI